MYTAEVIRAARIGGFKFLISNTRNARQTIDSKSEKYYFLFFKIRRPRVLCPCLCEVYKRKLTTNDEDSEFHINRIVPIAHCTHSHVQSRSQ